MILEGLEGTHQGGVRYPIPSFLRYTGQFPEHYTEMGKIWAGQSPDQPDESQS
jgi:hypothetical protein